MLLANTLNGYTIEDAHPEIRLGLGRSNVPLEEVLRRSAKKISIPS